MHKIVNTVEAGVMTNRYPGTLEHRRLKNQGPKYIKLTNGRVFYTLEAIEEYLSARAE